MRKIMKVAFVKFSQFLNLEMLNIKHISKTEIWQKNETICSSSASGNLKYIHFQMSEEQAFCTLVKIMYNYGLRDLYKLGFDNLHLRFFQLTALTKVKTVFL